MNEELNSEIYDDMEAEDSLSPRPRGVERKLHYSLAKTSNWIQEEIANAEPFLSWDNKSYFSDRQRLYALSFAYKNRMGEPSLISAIRWAKEKHVHVRALMKILSR